MKKIIAFWFVLLLISTKLVSQSSFYDMNTIQLIELTFTQSNRDYMMDTVKAGSEGYFMVSKLKINGVEYDSVGVKYKGSSTYRVSQVENPLHIEQDTFKEEEYNGFSDSKLSNHSALGERIASTHVPEGIIDSISFKAKTTDVSLKRGPDEKAGLVFAKPSFTDAINFTTYIDENKSSSVISVYPNPFSEKLLIKSGTMTIRSIRIVNLIGKTVFCQQVNNSNNVELYLSQFPKGIYMIMLNDEIGRKIIKN